MVIVNSDELLLSTKSVLETQYNFYTNENGNGLEVVITENDRKYGVTLYHNINSFIQGKEWCKFVASDRLGIFDTSPRGDGLSKYKILLHEVQKRSSPVAF